MDVEKRIDGLLQAGDLRAAAILSVETYGPELLGFLVAFLHDEHDANDVFSQACEDLWGGLARFDRRSSLRTWFYVLARHAASRFRRSPHRAPRRRARLSEMADIADRVRSRTPLHLRTDVKDRFASIRDALGEDDRALLVLRVDRDMSWSDIARIFSTEHESDEMLARVAARLRKRFQFVKEDIRRRARDAGLLSDDKP